MNHFENNLMNEDSTTDIINTLNEIACAINVNALMVAGGEAGQSETDAGAWWSMIALAEAALSRFPEKLRSEGYEKANVLVDRTLVEQRRRDAEKHAAERLMGILISFNKEG